MIDNLRKCQEDLDVLASALTELRSDIDEIAGRICNIWIEMEDLKE
jgi:hypothetical protein